MMGNETRRDRNGGGKRRRENCREKVTTRSWKGKKRKEEEKRRRSVEKIATNLEADKLGWNLQRVYSFYRCEGKGRHEDLFLLLFSKYTEHDHDSRNMNLSRNSHLSNSRRNFQGYNVAQVHVSFLSVVVLWLHSFSLSLSLSRIVLVKIIARFLGLRAVFSRPSQEHNRNLNYLGKLLRENQLYSTVPRKQGT